MAAAAHSDDGEDDVRGEEVFSIRKWNPAAALADPAQTIVVFGPSGSGKSVVMQNLMRVVKDKIGCTVGFMGSVDAVTDFQKCTPKTHVYEGFDIEKLSKVLEGQKKGKKVVLHTNRKLPDPADHLVLPYMAIVMDDCGFDTKSLKSEEIKYIFMNGRHDNIFFLCGMQYVMGMPMDIRQQIKIAISFPTKDPALLSRLREHLFGCFSSDEELANVFAILKPYEVLVYEKLSQSAGKPYLFSYKAEYPLPAFRAGKESFWRNYYARFKRVRMGPLVDHVRQTIRPRASTSVLEPPRVRGAAAKRKKPKRGAVGADPPATMFVREEDDDVAPPPLRPPPAM